MPQTGELTLSPDEFLTNKGLWKQPGQSRPDTGSLEPQATGTRSTSLLPRLRKARNEEGGPEGWREEGEDYMEGE